ncbi:MAG TPA: V-type ATP synthase subunit K [Spirochaetia bacterium]|nr:V-type ATP synthase subunit K [Spirochaetia bacterium]
MNFGLLSMGAVLSFAAMGSAIGAGEAGQSAIGAWKKCYAQNKPAPFLLIAFVGAPLTQTIYGLIVMGAIKTAAASGKADPWLLLGAGIGGIALGLSAWFQGRAGAAACDAFVDSGKGFANYILVLGIIETVALFVMVFLLGALGG